MENYLVIDLGGTGPKCVFWDGRRGRMMHFEPEVEEVLDPRSLEKSFSEDQRSALEDRIVVGVGGSHYAVGRLGRLLKGSAGLDKPKADLAGLRVLAAVGLALQSGEASALRPLHLGVYLPLQEYWHDRERLKVSLRQALSGFEFACQPMTVRLQRLSVLPEGAGVYLHRRAQQALTGKDVLAQRVVCVLMLGHRQSSLLTFDRGAQPLQTNSTSAGPGYQKVLEQLTGSFPGVAADDPSLLQAVLSGRTHLLTPGREKPFEIAPGAVEAAQRYYWQQLRTFLTRHLPPEVDELLVAGGPSLQLREQLQAYFAERGLAERVSWPGEDLHPELAVALGSVDPLTSVRFADAFAFLRWLVSREAAAV